MGCPRQAGVAAESGMVTAVERELGVMVEDEKRPERWEKVWILRCAWEWYERRPGSAGAGA